jgi:trans-aconitate methyltransferase
MRTRTILVFVAASCLAACGKQPPAEEAPAEVPADEAPMVADTAPAQDPAPAELIFDQAFIDHMHVHAERVDELMFALDDGDLEAAKSPAAWLSRHQAESRIPDQWQPYFAAMQEAARAVENATSLDTAREAAEKISVHCQECHIAAGINATE